MSTDKSAAAMKASEALREFISKYVNNNNEPTFLPDLTALISEHYYPKEKYDELLQQRDELKEALINVMVVVRDCYPLLFDNEKPAVKQAEAAIKNTER
jgi:hypothetical protein